MLVLVMESEAFPDYDPNLEVLEFSETCLIYNLSETRQIKLNNATIIRHYMKDDRSINCYVDNYKYLHLIFKKYINYCIDEVKQCCTAFIAQFQPFNETVKDSGPQFPTYAVAYEVVVEEETGGSSIQICYRQITSQSFLVMALDTYDQPQYDETIRQCLVIERNPRGVEPNEPMFTMTPTVMPILSEPNSRLNKRVILVAKNGWLAVFLRNSLEVYILVENEYAVFPGSMANVSVAYKRVMNLNSATSNIADYFYRRTPIHHSPSTCNGMFLINGVLNNEVHEESFTLLGSGSAVINLTYTQHLISMGADDDSVSR